MCDHEDSIIRVAFPRLVVGLGNPGSRYAPTRHNLGFRVVQELAAHLKLEFSEQDRAFLATPMATGPDSWVLMQPQTYMNLSGEAVSAWLDRHEVEPDLSRILVVCDDLALPLGHLRLRGKGTSGGQNGLLSIIEHLDSTDFARLRLGIDGTEGALLPEDWADYVLDPFPEGERESAASLVARAVEAVLGWGQDGPAITASRCNGPAPD
jgi:PTH1 family peptidyl-tRNA hydrolase|nr:aminoacyl-tRNA hydrolase [Candidatus Krumholzibacteria bacterium]